MEEAGGVLIFCLVIAVAIGCRLIAGQLNRSRIREYIEDKGGKIIKITWDPLGPGWFGEKSDAIYEVDYYDRGGNHRRSHCKTSMFSGVYLSNDKLMYSAKSKEKETTREEISRRPTESLEEENRRLKEEIRRLKEKRRDE